MQTFRQVYENTTYVFVLFIFNELSNFMREMHIRFVDIGGIVDITVKLIFITISKLDEKS